MFKKFYLERRLKFKIYTKIKISSYFKFLNSDRNKGDLVAFFINLCVNTLVIYLIYTPFSPIEGISFPNSFNDYFYFSLVILFQVFAFIMYIVLPYKEFSNAFNKAFIEIMKDYNKTLKGEMTVEEFENKYGENSFSR